MGASLGKQEWRGIQARLNELGYNAGVVDGIPGRKTREAIATFEKANGLASDGKADLGMLEELFSSSARVNPQIASKPSSAPATDVTNDKASTSTLAETAQVTVDASSHSTRSQADCDDWGFERFFKSATAADVQRCLDAGASLQAYSSAYDPPLMVAAEAGNTEATKVLLAAGAEVNARSKGGATILHQVVAFGNVETIKMLLNAGAEVNAIIHWTNRDTPLHYAVQFSDNKAEVALILIAAGADIEAENRWGQTLDLSFLGEEDLAKALAKGKAKRDASVNAKRNAKQIYLDCLDDWQSSDFFKNATRADVQHCLEAGAPLGKYSLRGSGSVTALSQAVDYQNVEAVRALIAAGADPNASDGHYSTPLHLAARNGNVDVAKVLLEAGAHVWEVGGRDLKLPLQQALEFDNHEVFMLLLDVQVKAMLGKDGFDITANAVRGAVAEGDLNAVIRLIKASYKGYGTNSLALNYISSIERQGALGAVRALIAAGADPNARNNDEETPLHGATWAGNIDVIEALLDAGADVNASQPNWGTPLHYAIQFSEIKTEVVLILIAAGADIEAENEIGQTPLMLAKQLNAPTEIIKILLEAGEAYNRLSDAQ